MLYGKLKIKGIKNDLIPSGGSIVLYTTGDGKEKLKSVFKKVQSGSLNVQWL